MSTKRTVATTDKADSEMSLPDMFAHLPPMDPFEIKRDVIAANMAALIVHSGKTRSCIAEELGIHKSAVTRLLSGKNNTKIKTIWEVASHLGYDFDIVFHRNEDICPGGLQPWHQVCDIAISPPVQNLVINMQTAEEVHRDLRSGLGVSVYFSVVKPSKPDLTFWDYADIKTFSAPFEFNEVTSTDAYLPFISSEPQQITVNNNLQQEII